MCGHVRTQTSKQAPIGWRDFAGVAESKATYGSERVREVAAAIESAIEPQVAIVDRTKKSDVQREMRLQIKRKLPSKMYGKTEQERVAEAIVDLLKVRKKR
jgi:hypothetical protein